MFVPQGWKLEYTGWSGRDAFERSVELAQLAEGLGYDHLWVYDHVETVPRRRPTHVFEAFTLLAALSQRTSRVGLGQLVTCASYRNVGLLAKEAACVDVYSAGRLILGLGAGWFHEEYHSYGYEYLSDRRRLAVLDETLEVVRRLWSEETVTFAGDHLHFDGAFCDPKPVQTLPPVLVGGGGEQVTLRIAARRADLTNWQVGLDAFVRKSRLLERYCDEVGRPFGGDHPDPRTGLPHLRHRRRVRGPGAPRTAAGTCGATTIPTGTSPTTWWAPSSRWPRRPRPSSTPGVGDCCSGCATTRATRPCGASWPRSCPVSRCRTTDGASRGRRLRAASRSSRSRRRSASFTTLPDGVLGSSSMVRTCSGHFWWASPAASRWCRTVATSTGSVPGASRTKAHTCSPRRGSGAATTATSTTPSMVISNSSTSTALMFSPPRMMMSFFRSVMVRNPAASSTPTSSVRYQPSSSNKAAVSAGSV